ncbi:MAG: hypothetical protein HC769_02355 [Cyanobacteria bacterium CRU_2_1]|nr:hypothetical protein [Cyanobacteria bacterium RU_5_0]NJR57793.1 hypothetical protein [Cyanobacteria bacterium CRU_2_1]
MNNTERQGDRISESKNFPPVNFLVMDNVVQAQSLHDCPLSQGKAVGLSRPIAKSTEN